MPKTVVVDKKASRKKGNNHGNLDTECLEIYKKFQREVQSILVVRGQKQEKEDQ